METSQKCAYCESKYRHVDFGDVEHIKPQAHFPSLALDYDNLTLSCAVCNNSKLDYYSPTDPLLDPYTDDPSQHLIGCGSLLWHSSDRGLKTIEIIKLNRKELLEKRFERMNVISALVDRYRRAADQVHKDVIMEAIRQEQADESEYALVVRCFVRTICPPLAI